MENTTITSLAVSIINDIMNKVTCNDQLDSDDEFDFLGIDNDDAINSSKLHQKPSHTITVDDTKPFKQNEAYNSQTPNTASNSSMSGSTKFIGTRSKLTTKSQVYKGNTCRSTNTFGSSNFNNQNAPKQGDYNVANTKVPEMYNQRMGQSQNMYMRANQYQSNKFGGFTGPYFADVHHESKSKSNLIHPLSKFSSDTRIIGPGKGYTFFEGIEELEFSQNQIESDSDDDSSRMKN